MGSRQITRGQCILSSLFFFNFTNQKNSSLVLVVINPKEERHVLYQNGPILNHNSTQNQVEFDIQPPDTLALQDATTLLPLLSTVKLRVTTHTHTLATLTVLPLAPFSLSPRVQFN